MQEKSQEPLDSEYSYVEMREALLRDDANLIIQMYEFLVGMGHTPQEARRSAMEYFSDPTPDAMSWPPGKSGVDLMPQVPLMQIPDTGSPPYFQPNTVAPTEPFWVPNINPYPQIPMLTMPTPDPLGAVKHPTANITNEPIFDMTGSNMSHTYNLTYQPFPGDDTNWVATGNVVDSFPLMANGPGWNTQKTIPEWRYNIEDSQMAPLEIPEIAIPPSDGFPLHEIEPELQEYVYQSHDSSDICAPFNGKTFDLLDTTNRPVLPSEGLGYTTQHPNCICYWRPTGELKENKLRVSQKDEIQTVHRKIGQRAHAGTLHKIKKGGEMSQKPGHRNFYRQPLHEAIMEVRSQFGWLTDEYLMKASELAGRAGGQLYLIKASEEAITDHRSEGEPLRRKLSIEELMAMARTGTNHGMDINHNPQWRTGATILDSEGDALSRSIQMVVLETDPEINQAIANGQITAVSINGGSPRSETIEPCDHGCVNGECELCVVPRGVILGELDDIGLTWVVTSPAGLMWKGQHIPQAMPGVKTTGIQAI